MNRSAVQHRNRLGTAEDPQQADGRARRWNHHREQRRLELLRLSRRAVAELGPGASMAEIAAACSTSKSVFYRYFKDKEGLRRELATYVVERMAQRMRSAAAEAPSFRASIRTIVEQYLWQLENAPDVYRFVTQGTDGSSEDPVGRFAAAVADLLVEAHRRHAPTERWLEPAMARYWAAGVVGMARGAGESWSLSEHDDRSSDERPQLDEFVEIVTGWVIAGTTPPGSEAAGSQTQARASP